MPTKNRERKSSSPTSFIVGTILMRIKVVRIQVSVLKAKEEDVKEPSFEEEMKEGGRLRGLKSAWKSSRWT